MTKLSINDVVTSFTHDHNAIFFQDHNGSSYCNLTKNNKKDSLEITSQQMRDTLRNFCRKKKIEVSKHKLEEIIYEFDSLAFESSNKQDVFIRAGVDKKTGYLYFDHCDDEGNITCVMPGKISTQQDCPISFIRPNKQCPIPIPLKEDYALFLKKFERLWNLKNKNYSILILVYILNALKKDSGSYAILILEGGQGQGKSTASKYIKNLIDPTQPPLSSPPRNMEQISVIASSGYLVAIDNISGINSELADAFCRISTGGGVHFRVLYTNNREVVYNLQRPVLINGIDEPTNRADFLDRAIVLELQLIPYEMRESEMSLQEKFQTDLPYLIGGIYSLLADVLERLPKISHHNLPRMTDYARIGIAVEQILGMEKGSFLKIYNQNIHEKSENSFWNDEMCSLIYNKLDDDMYKRREGIRGSIMMIKKDLYQSERGKFNSLAPKTIKGFASHLKRIEPVLKTRGIIVERLPRTASARELMIRFDDETFNKYPKDNVSQSFLHSTIQDPGIDLDLI
ncbi:MAG: hypothetical protein Q7U04_13585 [Bacteriovorax sp.]|nr:hypothetical protein [Bacteriovorax sp.]